MSSIRSRLALATVVAIAVAAPVAAQAPALADPAPVATSAPGTNAVDVIALGANLVDEGAVEVSAAARRAPTIMAMPASDVAFRSAHREIVLVPDAADLAPTVPRREAFSRPEVLMIVGGALIVTGLVVGSGAAPILYLAGAGIGGYGLYLYLQSPNARMAGDYP